MKMTSNAKTAAEARSEIVRWLNEQADKARDVMSDTLMSPKARVRADGQRQAYRTAAETIACVVGEG